MEEIHMSRFKRICVFYGSSSGKKARYQEAAIELGMSEIHNLVGRSLDLVYRGGSVGLMGLVSQAVHGGGRHVLEVIPKTLMPREVGLLNVDGYYNSLLSFIDKAVDEGFISQSARHIIVSAPTARELVRNLKDYEPKLDPFVPKLIWDVEPLGYEARPQSGVASLLETRPWLWTTTCTQLTPCTNLTSSGKTHLLKSMYMA